MTTSNDDARAGGAKDGECCAGCGAHLSQIQRYCLECGKRRGPLPALVVDRVNALKERGRREVESDSGAVAPAEPAVAGSEDATTKGPWDFMPSPQIAAVAVMALLAAGVVLGSVTSPLAQSAGSAAVILEELGGSEPGEEEPEATSAATSAAPASTAYVPAAEVPLAAPLPPPESAPSAPPAQLPPELPEEELLPEIKHVFMIVLDGHGYEEAFGEESSAPYLAKTLTGEGKLLSNYYAVTQGGLANQIALLSGQGPTPQTALDCPEYVPIAPGTAGAEGQVEGEGCVYPAEAETLPGQLTAAKLTWKAYVEPAASGEAAASPEDCFLTKSNPLAYFGGVTEGAECTENDVSLDQLGPDLRKADTTPSLSYILPNACHDGGETPCAPEQPAGLGAADGFLESIVPQITASAAYAEAGLIAITFDQAPQEGPAADSSSCCATPEYPNLPAATPTGDEPPAPGPVKPSGGGGRVGMLLLSPYVSPGSVDESAYYNHFSFLRSLEELFRLEPLGYAADPALTGFDSTVYDASPEESSLAERPATPTSHPPAAPTR